jgi:hypothetical protein
MKIEFCIALIRAHRSSAMKTQSAIRRNEMKRYMIERDIAGIGEFSLTELCGAARASNQALAAIGPRIQWQHSYVAGEKTFCIYRAESEAEITITEVAQIIDPLTANN